MQAINETKLNTLVGQMVGDLGAAVNSALVIIGDRLGLYKALATGPVTAQQLAERTSTAERYVQRSVYLLRSARKWGWGWAPKLGKLGCVRW